VHASRFTPAHRQNWRKSDIVVDVGVTDSPATSV
jgi:hypothetical protein